MARECREVLTVPGLVADETYRCERRKKRHRKHRARTYGCDEYGQFMAVTTWWRPRKD